MSLKHGSKVLASKALVLILATVMIASLSRPASAEPFVVKDGQPMAEIVVSEHPPTSVKLAAKELQAYVKKITGATLPIKPTFAITGEKDAKLMGQYPPDAEQMPVKIYLGESFHTTRLGVTDEGLDWGAYRIKSGENWLALVGIDRDFMPAGIWSHSRNHWQNEGIAAWKEAIGDHEWSNPVGFKMWNRYNSEYDLWSYDQTGTLNATYAFLRSLGVRWYMPGELGEVVPQAASIELPKVDKTVEPAAKIRLMSFARYGNGPHIFPEIQWALRIGLNRPFGYDDYHGLAHVTRPEKTRQEHPEFYALYNGQRDVESGTPNPCLSSDGLFEETVAYARFVFDMYGVKTVSVWPDDGFTVMCQCELCKGKDTPERGRQGVLSDYVWDFVNRVAIEVEKTHPDKLVTGGAYSTYWLPPENIDKLNDNVAVYIVNARRRYEMAEEDLEARRAAVRRWAELTDNKVVSFMNYGGAANTPRIFAEDIKTLSPLMMGEDMWVPHHRGGLAMHGFYHLNYYVSASLWWDVDQDIDTLLDEYYENFYGPAASEMAAFIDYYERHQQDMRGINSAPIIRKALDLFAAAEQKVSPESAYGQRVAMFSEGLNRIRNFYEQIKDGRQNPPVFSLQTIEGDISIDGKLDESFWQELPGTLKEVQSGDAVEYPTHFKIGVQGNNLYFAVKCMDEPGATVNAADTDGKDDSALWYGDAVEFLLETPVHSYYQIAISPDGAVCDLDREAGLAKGFNWSAEADIATHVNTEEGYWIVEARVPFTPSEQDPLHEIIGPAPSQDSPWFFNVCRQRVREEGNVLSAFSPTGQRGFHEILKFGKLEVE